MVEFRDRGRLDAFNGERPLDGALEPFEGRQSSERLVANHKRDALVGAGLGDDSWAGLSNVLARVSNKLDGEVDRIFRSRVLKG
ncbi:MAG: hypothetical protein IIA89_14140 [Chloroflexi bacterium]|nr:hypothetical protein [Chloroflexota bacterium]